MGCMEEAVKQSESSQPTLAKKLSFDAAFKLKVIAEMLPSIFFQVLYDVFG